MGRVMVVTGASRGIGAAIARAAFPKRCEPALILGNKPPSDQRRRKGNLIRRSYFVP